MAGTPGGPTANTTTAGTGVQERATDTARSAAETGKHVAGEAKVQATYVAGEASQQLQQLVDKTRIELRGQAGVRVQQTSARLRTLANELTALREGRTEEAGSLAGFVDDARTRITGLAERLDRQGLDGILIDVRRFARRRPGMFLMGSIAAGFALGRAVRAGAAASQESSSTAAQNGVMHDAAWSD